MNTKNRKEFYRYPNIDVKEAIEKRFTRKIQIARRNTVWHRTEFDPSAYPLRTLINVAYACDALSEKEGNHEFGVANWGCTGSDTRWRKPDVLMAPPTVIMALAKAGFIKIIRERKNGERVTKTYVNAEDPNDVIRITRKEYQSYRYQTIAGFPYLEVAEYIRQYIKNEIGV